MPTPTYVSIGSCSATANCGESGQPWGQAKQLPGAFHHQFALLLVPFGNHCSHIQSTGINIMSLLSHACS